MTPHTAYGIHWIFSLLLYHSCKCTYERSLLRCRRRTGRVSSLIWTSLFHSLLFSEAAGTLLCTTVALPFKIAPGMWKPPSCLLFICILQSWLYWWQCIQSKAKQSPSPPSMKPRWLNFLHKNGLTAYDFCSTSQIRQEYFFGIEIFSSLLSRLRSHFKRKRVGNRNGI